ncbi:MAG: hypothetical protein JXD23_17215 [Spirochaetales bacterium]|nr:hypothetical protein [Spirochaetales bacterium]
MNQLNELLESDRMNDRRAVQKALRRLDTSLLAIALSTSSPELREKIYKNVTIRARRAIEKEIELLKGTPDFGYTYDDMTVEKAQRHVAETLKTWTREGLKTETVYPKDLPAVKLEAFSDIIDTFERIGDHVFRHGLMSLDGIEEKTDDLFFKKAIQLLLDGYDPLIFDELLENYRERILHNAAVRMNMIAAGVKSLQMEELGAMKERMLSLSIE